MTVDEILAEHEDAVLALQTGGATSKSDYERREQALADQTRARLEGVLGGSWRDYETLREAVDRLDADPSEALTDAQLADAAVIQPGLAALTVDQLVSRAAAITEPVSAFAYLRAISERVDTPDTGTLESGPDGHYHRHTATPGRVEAKAAITRLEAVIKGTTDTTDPRPRLRELGRTRRDAIQAINRLNTSKAVAQRRASGHYGYYTV